MKPVLGLAVSAVAVRAVLVGRDAITWAGEAGYAGLDELTDVIARLAAERIAPRSRVRIALERDVVQLRTVVPGPPLTGEALRRAVSLEAPRLFRRTGEPLVTDARRVATADGTSAVWAVAASEPLVRAVLAGCTQAGLAVDAIGPAAEVLALAAGRCAGEDLVVPNGQTAEVLAVGPDGAWRSRLVRATHATEAPTGTAWVAMLARFGEGAPRYAAAFGAARARPRLALWPAEMRADRARRSLRRTAQLAAVGLALWVAAAAAYVARASWSLRNASSSLAALAPTVDSALAVRRELGLARAALATMAAAERDRSQHLRLLADLTAVLEESTYLAALELPDTGPVRITGFSQSAARALASLERLTWLRDVRFEGPVTREASAGSGERERFTIVGHGEHP